MDGVREGGHARDRGKAWGERVHSRERRHCVRRGGEERKERPEV